MSSKTTELVESVLSAMNRAAESGDPDAVDSLKKESGEAKAKTVVEEPKLRITDKTVIRPNGETYYVREIEGHHDVMVLREARARNLNVLAYGPPGTGKTALIEAAFCSYEPPAGSAKVYTVQGTGDTETADFVGSWVQMPDGTYDWEDGPLLLAMDEGAALYIDEIALIDPKVLALVYGVMDGRNELRITANPDRGVVTAQPGFYVVAACNPNAPGARMSEALLSRFGLQFQVTTDYSLAKTLGVSNKIVTAATNLMRKWEKDECSWAPQLRELIDFKRVSDMLGEKVALRNMVATAPEMDRQTVADVLSRSFAMKIEELALKAS